MQLSWTGIGPMPDNFHSTALITSSNAPVSSNASLVEKMCGF